MLLSLCSGAQSWPTLGDPTDWSPPGSLVYGVFRARLLEWAAVPSSRASSRLGERTRISHVSCLGRRILYH